MAKTGIDINVTNTQLGGVPQVNGNSLLVVFGAADEDSTELATMPFKTGVSYLVRSVNDIKTLGLTEAKNATLIKQVRDYFNPVSGVDNSGGVLWIYGVLSLSSDGTGGDVGQAGYKMQELLQKAVMATTVPGFQYRPRNIMLCQEVNNIKYIPTVGETPGHVVEIDMLSVQKAVDALYTEGITCVALVGLSNFKGELLSASQVKSALPDLSLINAPMVGQVIVTNETGAAPCVGAIGGFMATLSVGTSIGDASFAPFADTLYLVNCLEVKAPVTPATAPTVTWINSPCSTLYQTVVNELGAEQYIFGRTRPPKNGIWLNDGATAVDPATAMSTLEAGRTIASIVDDLRSYFTPYINSRVPVDSTGALRSDYTQVVISGARAKVIQPYIDNGDISDAQIELRAKNDDFIGTRTWEVTVKILPALTLRWIDGYVFYVSSLS